MSIDELPDLAQFGVPAADVEEVIRPFLAHRFAANDPEWRRLYARTAIIRALLRYKRQSFRWLGMERRFGADQAQHYTGKYAEKWREDTLDQRLALRPGPTPCLWRDMGLRLNAIAIKRVHQLYLTHLLETLKPKTVLEVGCGLGLNLFVLAACFPDVRFYGVELNADAVASAKAVIREPRLPAAVAAFSPAPIQDESAHTRVAIEQGNATRLAQLDRSADLVFTVQAPEQMEPIRHQALSEIARVARHHVAMFEAFRDWNANGLRRNCIVGKNFFQAWMSDLAAYRLEPIYAQNEMPSKIDMSVGLVVARIANSPAPSNANPNRP